jgi:phage gpG-like protein
VTPGEAADQFGAAAVRAGSLVPVLEDFAAHMKLSIKENFVAQGRPSKWKEVEMHPGHQAILVDTATLVDSTTAFVDGNTDVVLAAGGNGQRAAKAPSLQWGANLNMRRRRDTGQFASKRARKNVSRGDVIGYGVLPARPYLLFQDEDLRYLGTMLPDFIFKVDGSGAQSLWPQVLR